MPSRRDPLIAESIMLENGLRPKAPYPGAGLPWLCACLSCGKESSPQFDAVRRGRSKCRHCSYAKQGIAQRNKEDEIISVMVEIGKVRPKVPYINNSTPWLSDCLRCGKEVSPRYESIRRGQRGCKYCRLEMVAELFRLTDEEARKIMIEEGGVVPKVPYPGRNRIPWLCECLTCGAEVTPTINSAKSSKSGCRYCAGFGFKSEQPGRLYIISHDRLLAVKVGVTTSDNDRRINSYKRAGWGILSLRSYNLGRDALIEEQRILSEWRTLGYPIFLQQSDLPKFGYTETASIEVLKEWSLPAVDLLDRTQKILTTV